ncbi:MAG: hypothetical protein KC444_03755 [Nitrosopumilus sp.]|nr:hypothetical protein [Nitrosopumilus sp.]
MAVDCQVSQTQFNHAFIKGNTQWFVGSKITKTSYRPRWNKALQCKKEAIAKY